MKSRYLLTVIALVMALTSVTAQRMQQKKQCNEKGMKGTFCLLDDLSEEQQENLKAERVKFYKETQINRNQLGELMAKKRTLQTIEPIDEKGLNKLLAEINQVKSSMAKKQVRHKQSMKAFFTDEQLIAFEQNRGKSQMRGHGKGRMHNIRDCKMANAKQMKARHGGQRKGQSKGKPRKEMNRGGQNMISDELRAELKASHTELMKQQQPLNNQLNELKAQFKTLTYGKTIDLKQVDKNIDKQAAIKLEIEKLKSNQKLQLRSKLSDEQKIWFDKHQMRRKNKHRMN
ncbi:hypothetical protein [Carboxylicivirga marina]|uniref:Periplasmic heavy metal sensor n=1 Tax=Carboxylicivirga marina TaxID=2800988 RepID=A0ABS1HP42_9BACT|nr:hypothetical protein [Carboxylicivirga marina]MBK3519292.1 hypothetical protein [Carboxylicivirga marina]